MLENVAEPSASLSRTQPSLPSHSWPNRSFSARLGKLKTWPGLQKKAQFDCLLAGRGEQLFISLGTCRSVKLSWVQMWRSEPKLVSASWRRSCRPDNMGCVYPALSHLSVPWNEPMTDEMEKVQVFSILSPSRQEMMSYLWFRLRTWRWKEKCSSYDIAHIYFLGYTKWEGK